MSPRTASCPGCGATVQCYTFGGRPFYECPPCDAAEKARRRLLDRRSRALLQWEAIIPPAMRAPIDRSLISPQIAEALDTDGQAGCALVGETGGGKTRVASALLKMAAMRGLTVFSVTHAEFRRAIALQHDANEGPAAKQLINSARHAQALLIDDLGKGANTEIADEGFFDLLSHRRDHHMLTASVKAEPMAWPATAPCRPK